MNFLARTREQITDQLYIGSSERPIKAAFLDVVRAFYALPRAFSQATLDISQRYRRSIIGPFWLVIGKVALALGYTTLGSQIFKIDTDQFLLYVLTGITVWQFISACMLDATGMFVSESSTLTSSHPSHSSLALRVVIRQLLIMMHSVPVVLMLAWMGGSINEHTIWVIPALFAVGVAMVPAVLLISIISTRLRDFGQLVTVTMQFAVFLTPVFWMASAVPKDSNAHLILMLNPFSHILAVLRDPIMGLPPSIDSWISFAIVAGVVSVLALLIFPGARGRVVYWL